ncbi:hypothetical protein [Inquilinus sp.]|uniref:hypothetical protein n=1 Tax=Inquilinus sp. TaxID=1932117 RepID=UPI0031DDA207
MRQPLLLAAALGFSLPALAQGPAYHLQLQVNVSTDVGRGSCRVGTGVIGTYPDSGGRLPIGTPVELIIPCAMAGASYYDARLVGAPGAFQPAGPNALRPLQGPVALPSAPSPFQPPQRQVLVAPTAPVTPRPMPPAVIQRPAPQPVEPLPVNPVAPSRPLVTQGGVPMPQGTVPPGPVFTPAPASTFPAPPPPSVTQGGDTATMRGDAAIVLNFGPVSAARAGTSQRVVLPTDPSYPALLTQLGGIAPGQTKVLPR